MGQQEFMVAWAEFTERLLAASGKLAEADLANANMSEANMDELLIASNDVIAKLEEQLQIMERIKV